MLNMEKAILAVVGNAISGIEVNAYIEDKMCQ